MSTLTEIEQLTRDYAEARARLVDVVNELHTELERVKHPRLAAIRARVGAAAEAHARLKAAIEASPTLFVKPKTKTIAGIRFGYMKSRGKVVFADEAAVIERIYKLLPKDQAELLIRVEKSVHKPAVYDLSAGDLKRLGITITDDEEVAFIKPVDGEVDKLVNALLADAERMEQERAA